MWLLREVRAQLVRFGLALGVLAAGIVILGTCLPLVDGGTRLGAPARAYGSSPVSLDNALIRYQEGWLLFGTGAAALLLLAVYRRYRFGRVLVALLVIGIALAVPRLSDRAAAGPLLDPCSDRSAVRPADYACPVDQLFHVQSFEPGYGFLVVEIGAAGLAAAGLLLLLPSTAPRNRRWTVPGREAVVWL